MFKLVALMIILLGAILATSVWARGGHHHHHHGWGGLGLDLALGYSLGYGYRGFGGYGWGYPGYRYRYDRHYPPYYAYPPIVAIPSSPPVYIQQQGNTNRAAIESRENYWYYCRKLEGYYPHIKKCLDGWMQVVPQPPAQ